MPLISTKGVYGLAAMYELSLQSEGTLTQIREISANADIPQNYLEQLLGKLKKAGFVKSIRGSRGGYLLAKKAEDILVKDILVVLEGDIKVIEVKNSNPVLNLFYEDVNEKMNKLFDLSLSDLQVYRQQYNEFLHYSI